jgi:hypothetical protein
VSSTQKPKKMPAATQPLLKPVYLMTSYRDYLRYVIQVNEGTRGFRTRLAEAASCQPSYLSQVLGGTASFSLDQLLGIARYLGLNESEWEYLRELGILDRAGGQKLREDCESRLNALRERRGGAVAAMVQNPDAPSREDMVWYASSYQHGQIFVSLSDQTARTTAEVATQHRMDPARVGAILEQLARRRFVTQRDGKWLAATPVLYWQESATYHTNRMNWLMRAQMRRMEGYEDGLHLGCLTTMDPATFAAYRKEFLAHWQRCTHAWSEPARTGEGKIVYFGIDYFEA